MNRTALVTGAAGLLGKEITITLLKNSFNVVINYYKSEYTAALTDYKENRYLLIKADVSKSDDVKEMSKEVYKRFGRIDIIINNAAITRDELLIKYKESDWEDVINVNLKGAFNCIKTFVPLMKDGGHIINISSYSGLKGKAGQAAYSASKAALIGLTRTAAKEFAHKNIRVNAVVPGYMASNMGMLAQKAMQEAIEKSLLKTLCDPIEVAKFILYLIETKTITGQIFCLDNRIF
jgi:3-oxoacyl-[acyl-carrier protein] reductase